MRKANRSLLKQTLSIVSLAGLIGCAVMIVAAGCGKEPGDRAKSTTDTVVKKGDDVKNAVAGKEESRAEVEARLTRENADLSAKIADLEAKQNQETDAKIRAANKVRLDRVRASLGDANDRSADLKKSSDSEWKAKKDAAAASLENAKAKVASALDRQTFKEDVSHKLTKIEKAIESLKADAAGAPPEKKRALDKARGDLESKHTALKADYARFQESTDDKWDNFKQGFSKAFDEISATFKGLFD